jgi:pimeloyl-ACP methyl ester carboxylesterase
MEQSLLDQGFRLIIPNRPGYLDTPIPCGRTTADAVWLACQVLDHLKIGRVGVIGTSGGGPAAAAFASTCVDRIAALVLQCAQTHQWNAPEWLPIGKGWILPLVRRRLTKRLVTLGHHWQTRCLPWMTRSYLKAITGRRFEELQGDLMTRELCEVMVQFEVRCITQPAGIDNDLDILLNEPILGDNGASVRCPALIIHDPCDPVVPFAHALWAGSHLPNATVCEIQAGGHLVWIGRDRVAMLERRRDFLRQHVSQ